MPRLHVLTVMVFAAACPVRAVDQAAAVDPPWNLDALFEPPKMQWLSQDGGVWSLTYHGPAFGEHDKTSIFAYYATPGTLAGDRTLDKDLPAIVLIHGGGGTAFAHWAAMWAKRGYAAIAMDLGGDRPIGDDKRERLADGGPGQGHDMKFDTIDQPKTQHWSYHAVANCIAAHSLIRSFEEVDAERTAVTGISWGGYLTCIVASLDDRFKAAVPVYGCGFLHHNSTWLGEFEKLGPERTDKWVRLYDPSSYLPHCRVPMLFVNGTNDFAYPLDSYMESYRALPAEMDKNIRVEVKMPHSHFHGWMPKAIAAFVDAKLRGGQPLAKLHASAEDDGSLRIRIEHAAPGALALHYTTGTGPINQRDWQTVPLDDATVSIASAGGAQVLASGKPLPVDATAWFVTLTDDQVMVSSEVAINNRVTQ